MKGKKLTGADIRIIIIYVLCLVYFLIAINVYDRISDYGPDGMAHISYIAYLDRTEKVLPNFEDEHIYAVVKRDDDEIIYMAESTGVSYLGHPPLYYHVMNWFVDVEQVDTNCFTVSLKKLNNLNIILVVLSFAVLYYLGYTRIERNTGSECYHLMYATICTLPPMTQFEGAVVTNDNLLFLCVAIFMFGVCRYFEEKHDILTYVLVAIGFTGFSLVKATMVVYSFIVIVMIVVVDSIAHKKLRIFNKNFFISLPIYLITLGYYAYVYLNYGTLQPTLEKLAPDQYYNSAWYIAEESRVYYSRKELLKIILETFERTYTSAYTSSRAYWRQNLSKQSLLMLAPLAIAVIAMIVIFVLMVVKKQSDVNTVYAIATAALIVSIIFIFKHAVDNYDYTGRVGGVQARYYTCCMPVVGLCNVSLFMLCENLIKSLKAKKKQKIKSVESDGIRESDGEAIKETVEKSAESEENKKEINWLLIGIKVVAWVYAILLVLDTLMYFFTTGIIYEAFPG